MWTARPLRVKRVGFGKLEVLLIVAVFSLMFQLFPALWLGVLRLVDVRHWPGAAWLVLNIGVVFALFAIRLGPQLYSDWQENQNQKKVKREKQEHQRQLKEQKALFERMKEARKRRIY